MPVTASDAPQPFSNRPEPRVYYQPRSHEPLWRALRTALGRGEGIILITGEPGSGKTLLLHRLLETLPGGRRAVLINNPANNADHFLQQLIDALTLPEEPPLEGEHHDLQEQLFALLEKRSQGASLLVMVDEAHRLADDSLEHLDLVARFIHNDHKPVQFLLAGRRELDERLTNTTFDAFQDSLSGLAALTPLTHGETVEYVRHQLRQGGQEALGISWAVWPLVYLFSRGNPRQINLVFRQLLSRREERPGPQFLTGEEVFNTLALLDPLPALVRSWRWTPLALMLLLALLPAITYLLGASDRALPIAAKVVVNQPPPAIPAVDNTLPSESGLLLSADFTSAKVQEGRVAVARFVPPALKPRGEAVHAARETAPATVKDAVVVKTPVAVADPAPVAFSAGERIAPLPLDEETTPAPPLARQEEVVASPVDKPRAEEVKATAINGAGKSSPAVSSPLKDQERVVAEAAASSGAGRPITVQSGSFKSQENAERVIARLREKGYSSYVRQVKRGNSAYYAVRTDFPTLTQAQQAMKVIEQAEGLPVMLMHHAGTD